MSFLFELGQFTSLEINFSIINGAPRFKMMNSTDSKKIFWSNISDRPTYLSAKPEMANRAGLVWCQNLNFLPETINETVPLSKMDVWKRFPKQGSN